MDLNFKIEAEIKEDLKTVSKIKIDQWKNKALNNPTYFTEDTEADTEQEGVYQGWMVSLLARSRDGQFRRFAFPCYAQCFLCSDSVPLCDSIISGIGC